MYSHLIFLTTLIMCDCITITYVNQDVPDPVKSKIELRPIEIYCELNDIVTLTAPAVNGKEVKYNLHKPNGDVLKLDFRKNKKSENTEIFSVYNDLVIIKYINKDIKAVYPERKFKIVNGNVGLNPFSKDDVLGDAETDMKENDFMIGPVSEEDHGNWVLSILCRDIDGDWIELFQVISIHIIVSVPMIERNVKLKEGDTFNLSFPYSIKGLETCELSAPRTTFDRYFDRSRIELDRCGYVISNVTGNDIGQWKVTGVGRIIYEGVVDLNII